MVIDQPLMFIKINLRDSVTLKANSLAYQQPSLEVFRLQTLITRILIDTFQVCMIADRATVR